MRAQTGQWRSLHAVSKDKGMTLVMLSWRSRVYRFGVWLVFMATGSWLWMCHGVRGACV